MKKSIKTILMFLMVVLLVSITGCEEKDSSKLDRYPVVEQKPERTIYEEEIIEKEPVSLPTNTTSEYTIGKVFLNYQVSTKPQSVWYFNGFIGEDTFVISRIKNPSLSNAVNQEFFCPLEEGFVMDLPDTNAIIKLVSFNLQKKTIVLEQIIQK